MLIVYSKANCPQCDNAKGLLKLKEIQFNEIKVDQDKDAREWLMEQGHRSVPQLYLDGELFVENGYTGLSKLTDDQLKEKLNVSN
jgi:glutaredoxin 3